MNILPNTFIAVSAIAALLFDPFHGVEGAVASLVEIQCLPEAPQVCSVEMYRTSPVPGTFCTDWADPTTCETVYMGGYSWSWKIVENLVDGYDADIDKAREDAVANGLNVHVHMENLTGTCEISIDETCIMCSAEGCEEHPEGYTMVQYDCTNLENGRSSDGECVPLASPFLYPFITEMDEEAVAPEAPDSNLEALFGSVDSSARRITIGAIMSSIMMLTAAFI